MLVILLLTSSSTAAEIVVIGPKQATASGYGTSEIALPELQWLVHAPYDLWGTSVQLSGGPFVHTQKPEYQVDCRLNFRVLRVAGRGQWQVTTASDSTHVIQHDGVATVTAAATGNGVAILGLQTTFVPPPGRPVPAGVYVTEVVGLVTGI